jgi:5-methylcytosine-specific restriction enzyme A
MPKLRTLAPLVRTRDLRTIHPPPKLADPVYATPQFRAWRATILARAGGQCEAVDDHGNRCTKAQPRHRMFADHIVELRDGGSLLDLANGQCLCGSHHEIKTVAIRRLRVDRGSLAKPNLPRPNCRVKLICGPPASGKSTFVRANAGPHDIVIDLDMIALEFGLGRNRDGSTGTLLVERNRRLASLASEPAHRVAWVIVGAPSKQLRQWWCDMLGVVPGDMVLLVPTRTELRRRVMADPDRADVIDRHLAVIDRWLARDIGVMQLKIDYDEWAELD